jgi:hypothetical protein
VNIAIVCNNNGNSLNGFAVVDVDTGSSVPIAPCEHPYKVIPVLCLYRHIEKLKRKKGLLVKRL